MILTDGAFVWHRMRLFEKRLFDFNEERLPIPLALLLPLLEVEQAEGVARAVDRDATDILRDGLERLGFVLGRDLVPVAPDDDGLSLEHG